MSSNERRLRGGQSADHVSSLPDPILGHILSFVPTKSAVKTSILSKRWKYVWTKVPTIDFTECPNSECPKKYFSFSWLTLQQKAFFKSFVDRVLLHNDVSYIQSLRFKLTEDHLFYINSWLRALTRREILDIHIRLDDARQAVDPVVLPTTFLWKERLVALELMGKFTVNVPIPLHLPNLEILQLNGFQLPDDEFMKTLSSSCPVLKELDISHCFGVTNIFYVESLTIEKLTVIETVKKSPKAGSVIKAPNLRSLHFEDCLYEPLTVIGELSLLVEAYLDIEFFNDTQYVVELVKRLSAVQTLRIIADGICNYVIKPTSFQNLITLRIVSDDNMLTLLECAPNLKSLIIEADFLDDPSTLESKSVPKCLSSLESVEMVDFDGLNDDVQLIAYFLKFASTLRELKICLSIMPLRGQIDLYKMLLKLPRTSVTCQVTVEEILQFS